MARKIILDSDPGHDDAVAILLAAGNPNIDLLSVTTVGGNQSLDKVTYNARAVLEKAHRTDIPVYAGCDRPLVRPQEVAASIHGQTGLDGVELPVPTRPLEDMHAVNFIVKTIMENEPGTITLVPTGPLTNIAMAVRMEPRIVERVKEVVLMGGGYHVGNWSAVAEFNIKIDPEALDPEDVDMLQDMIVAAVNQGLEDAQELASKRMSAVTGGMNIPGLF